MATIAYANVLEMAERLSTDERVRLIDQLSQAPTEAVRSEASGGKKHSILELRGLGKEFWQTIDTDEYLRNERSSWDG